MEHDVWEVIKAAIQWLILPLIAAIMFFFRKYIQRVENVEKRINEMEIRVAVVENNISHIRKDIEDIKKGIDKLLDRL